MARPLFEQYKDALRRGHVALLNDEFDVALAAYREAAALVPDRPLPFASIGGVLDRLNRPAEALNAYDRALTLTPDDAAIATARAAAAAAAPAVASVAATAEAARAVEPEPDPVPERVPEAEAVSEVAPAPTAEPIRQAAAVIPTEDAAADAAAGAQRAAEAAAEADALEAIRAALEPRLDEGWALDDEPPASDDEAAADLGPADVAGTNEPPPIEAVMVDGQSNWPAIDLPSPPPAPLVGPPPDPAALQAEADALLDGGDSVAARDQLLLAVVVHRDAGRLDAALDSCLQLLAIAPGDPRVHLAIANLQLDRGWRPVATEKIELLLRLTSLSGDAPAEADVHLLAANRLRDEDPARLDARRRGLPSA
jgi:tetratricopeptide (TPR) repeat protein